MAKSGIQGLATGRSDLFRMDPNLIVVKDDWNARDFSDPDNIAHVHHLKESIRAVGVLEPLTVYIEDGQLILTNGESRLRAVRELIAEGVEIKTIPVQAEPRHASEADKLASQIVRNSGKPFTALEQAQVYTRLIGLGWTEKDIAARAGLTVERIKQILSLNQVPAYSRKQVKSGKVSATVVQRIVAKAKTPKEIDKAVKEAVAAATAEGRKKAGPRHVAGTKASVSAAQKHRHDYKALVQELLSYMEPADEPEANGTLPGTFAVPAARWMSIQSAVK